MDGVLGGGLDCGGGLKDKNDDVMHDDDDCGFFAAARCIARTGRPFGVGRRT